MRKSILSSVGAGKAAANQGHGSHVMVFDNPQFGTIRTMTDENGEPLFCGKDVCEALGYRKIQNAINQHVSPHDALKQGVRVPCGKKRDGSPAIKLVQMIFVNESGFYALVLGSKLDTAQKFKLWVTSEVLPQIRKTGGYIPLRQGDTDEDVIRRTEKILRSTIEQQDLLIAKKDTLIREQEKEIDHLLPKALYADNVLDSVSCYTTTQVAKESYAIIMYKK